jgi:predicted CXXCH cytochrome family protein
MMIKVSKSIKLGSMALISSICLMSGANAGTIVGSAHDFSNLWGSDEICIFCHTPHNADTTIALAPLWNHEITTATYTTYDSATLDADVGQPGGISILCLSCHDGTVAVDSFGGKTGTRIIPEDSRVYIGKDLSDDHPISFIFDDGLAALDSGLHYPSSTTVTIGSDKTKTGTISDVLLFNDKLECASCHDVHNTFTTTDGYLLKISNVGSGLCLTCHDK